MLFVELALIRYGAAYIAYLAYFTNFVLLASFLGIGIGFLRGEATRSRFSLVPVVLMGLLGFITLFPVQVSRADGRSFSGLFGMFALPIWVSLPLIFIGVATVLALIAQEVAGLFVQFRPLDAYRLDIAGSLVGISVFSVLSFLELPPIIWGLVVVGVFLVLLRGRLRVPQWAGLAGIVIVLSATSFIPGQRWSPYYRVTAAASSVDGSVSIKVNGLPHQTIVPLDRLRGRQAFYLYPYRHLATNPLRSVLIVGAGSGNDVAVALSKGARHVDAVEIDPVIWSIGNARHPDRPYQDPRVSVHINDGRAFLQRTNERYDLIVFALPDSLTLVSGQSSLRLESYLFTLQAMQKVRAHLEPGGAFTMYNYYRPDVFARFAQTINQAFSHPPCIDIGPDQLGPRRQAVLTVGLAPKDVSCTNLWTPGTGPAPLVATDDHPFPYLASRSIPRLYLIALMLILVASVVGVRAASRRPFGAMRPFVDLFFMGTAFLLLETKNVVQFALLFGTTWFVNSLVFAGILLAVLGAVEVARRARLPGRRLLYLLLAASLVLAWAVPPSSLLRLAFAPRFAAAVALAFAPVFLANLVFSQRFRDLGASTVAFGANLLGAMVGGVLEYGALVVGYRNLLVLVALLYALAFITGRRHLGASTETETETGAGVRATSLQGPRRGG